MTGEATTAEIEAAARELGGFSAEQLERWRHTTGGQRATRDAEAALAAVLPLVEARLREQWDAEHAAEVERLRAENERLRAAVESAATTLGAMWASKYRDNAQWLLPNAQGIAKKLRAALTPDGES